jgi:hypothetical protein
MTEQEMQLLLAFAAAKQGNKNVGGVLGNLDNPMLAVLAGAYDPRTGSGAQSGGGPFWSKYSQSQDPVIQDIIAKISQGFDKYQLNSYIDSLAAQGQDLGSFQVGDLKGVAASLQKEYVDGPSTSGGAASKDPFSKAGIPNPSELYDVSTVPISAPNAKRIQDIQTKLAADTKGYGDVVYNTDVARRAVGQGNVTSEGDKRLKTSEVFKWLEQSMGQGKGNLALNRVRSSFKNNPSDEISLSDLNKSLNEAGAKVYKNSNPKGVDVTKFKQGVAEVTGKAKKAQGIGYNKAANKKYDDAMFKKVMMETKSGAARQREEAVREGQMQYAAETGATPSTDAMKQILKFIAATK